LLSIVSADAPSTATTFIVQTSLTAGCGVATVGVASFNHPNSGAPTGVNLDGAGQFSLSVNNSNLPTTLSVTLHTSGLTPIAVCAVELMQPEL
jgi:hypothetical protein